MTISAMHGQLGALDLQVVLTQDMMTALTERQYSLMDRSSQIEMSSMEFQHSQSENVWMGADSMQYVGADGTPYWQPSATTLNEDGSLIGNGPLSAAPAGTFDASTVADLGAGVQVVDAPATPGGAVGAVLQATTAISPNDFFYEEILPPAVANGPPIRRLVRIPAGHAQRNQIRFNAQQGHFTFQGRIAFQLGKRPAAAGGGMLRFSGRMMYIPKGQALARTQQDKNRIKKEELMIQNLMKKLQTKLEMLMKQIDQVRGWLKKRVEDWFKGIGDQR